MPEAVNGLIDDVMAKYRADPDRVYLTGLSMVVTAPGPGLSCPGQAAAAAPTAAAATVMAEKQESPS